MQIHDALGVALVRVRRSDDQAPKQSDGDGDERQSAEYSFAFSCRLRQLSHFQLSITQSKISTPAVKNITSKPISRRSHGIASPNSPVRNTFSMQRIVARMTGTMSGKSTSGKSSSRARARKVIADVIVPKTQKPTVPSKVTRNNCGSKFHERRLKSIQNSGITTISTITISIKLKKLLARNSAPRSSGASSRASRQWFSRSGWKSWASPKVPVKRNASQSNA